MPTILPIAILLLGCDGKAEPASPADPVDTGGRTTLSSTTSVFIPTPKVVIVDAPTPVGGDLERIAEGEVSGVVAMDAFTVLYSDDVGLHAVDPFHVTATWGAAPGSLTGAVRWGEVSLVAVGNALYDFDGVALRPSLMQPVVGPASVLVAQGDDVWIGADAGLRRWRAGQVVALTVGDDEVGAFAVGGDVRGNDVVWVAQGDILHGVGNAGELWVDLEAVQLTGDVDSVAVDGLGVAWAAAGGWLHRRDPVVGWQRLDVGTPVWEVHGHADAVGVWIEQDQGWLRSDGVSWEAVADIPVPKAGRSASVDSAGRLVLHDDDGAWRASTTRPLVVVGLDPGAIVGRATEVTLLPTTPDEVEQLTAEWVGPAGQLVALDVADGVVAVNPDGLDPGPWTFRAEATYSGRSSVAEVAVFLGAGFEPTWSRDIEPIYQNACAVCHGGAAATVLETPEDWEEVIDLVLYNVEVGNMPLGGTPLSDVQVVLIEAWKDGGFAR